jgi:DNA modification methylase
VLDGAVRPINCCEEKVSLSAHLPSASSLSCMTGDHHLRVTDPSAALPERSDLVLDTEFDKLTHYLFRYPAKFHPPVVRALLDRYTEPEALVLDPFVGSGTLLVEAVVKGRSGVGVDVDPVAVAVSNAKTARLRPDVLSATAEKVRAAVAPLERAAAEYEDRMFKDLTDRQFVLQRNSVAEWVPDIPKLEHWFRRYVIVDLARMRKAIAGVAMPDSHRPFIDVVFASIIRNSSNADPVPVSGLEFTSHMRRRDEEGRLVNPFALFNRALERAEVMAGDFYRQAKPGSAAAAFVDDATELAELGDATFDAMITSPPYHGAVDYYRRHQLEMFWLGSVENQADRLELLHRYVGRPKVPQKHSFVASGEVKTTLAKSWERRMREVDSTRADAFRHYIVAMSKCFEQLGRVLKPGAPAVFVVGHSSWNSDEIPTTDLFAEIAGKEFVLDDLLAYPVKNRYMSYSRRNDADINQEHVLVFRRMA